MFSKVPLLSPLNYVDWKPKMSTYLKRQCLFDVSIDALSKPESYEEKSDSINDCDKAYGIMCLAMSPKIHHLIVSIEYPFQLWNNLDKDFGVQEEEDEAWSKPNISSCALSQYVSASTFSDEVVHNEEFTHKVLVATILFDSNASSFYQEANIEQPYFSVSLEVEDPNHLLLMLMMKKK